MNFRVISMPGRGAGNPYIDLFYDALMCHRIELVGELRFDKGWFDNNSNNFDAIHLHWPDVIWRGHKNSLLTYLSKSGIKGSWRLSRIIENIFSTYLDSNKLKWFIDTISFIKKQNKKIVLTWHNIQPHENYENIDYLGYKVLAENSDLVIFHTQWAEEQCRKLYDIKGKTVVMPIGNYDGVYPEPRDRSIIINELGFDPDKPIVGCFGAIREYKGIDIACEAVEKLNGSVQFLCAGWLHDDYNINDLKKKISKIKKHVFEPRMISDQEFVDFINICECILLPYKKVTGSSALLASLTLHRGVIASDLPFFREILDGMPNAGRLVVPGNSIALSHAILDYLNVSSEVRASAARKLADNYSWQNVIKPVVDIINAEFIKSHN